MGCRIDCEARLYGTLAKPYHPWMPNTHACRSAALGHRGQHRTSTKLIVHKSPRWPTDSAAAQHTRRTDTRALRGSSIMMVVKGMCNDCRGKASAAAGARMAGPVGAGGGGEGGGAATRGSCWCCHQATSKGLHFCTAPTSRAAKPTPQHALGIHQALGRATGSHEPQSMHAAIMTAKPPSCKDHVCCCRAGMEAQPHRTRSHPAGRLHAALCCCQWALWHAGLQ
jgi:hypothetical protein